MQQHEFEQRIARAKEAARLASLAASARSGPAQLPPTPPLPPASSAAAVPDDVRHRVDRLVAFVQRNGAAFEDTVRQRERDNPNFAFLHPHARFHDYYEWRKRHAVVGGQAPGPQPLTGAQVTTAPGAPDGALLPTPNQPPLAPVSADALLSSMSVGALASVCRLARQNGLAPYAPLPPELLWNSAALPHVEPARLEIRLAEFYRQLK